MTNNNPGKSAWAIERIQTDQERQYIHVMPFLDEAQRESSAIMNYRGTHDGKA